MAENDESDLPILDKLILFASMIVCGAVAWQFIADKALAVTIGFIGGIIVSVPVQMMLRDYLLKLIDKM